MARYIDADVFEVVTFENVSEEFMDGADFILEKIDNCPTEDVVPRSEVEELETRLHLAEEAFKVASENAESARDRVRELEKQIEQAKQEVAKLIFEDIEANLNNLIRYYKEKREYVTKVEYNEAEQRYCDIKIRTFEERLLKIAELKKKYIGETE